MSDYALSGAQFMRNVANTCHLPNGIELAIRMNTLCISLTVMSSVAPSGLR